MRGTGLARSTRNQEHEEPGARGTRNTRNQEHEERQHALPPARQARPAELAVTHAASPHAPGSVCFSFLVLLVPRAPGSSCSSPGLSLAWLVPNEAMAEAGR